MADKEFILKAKARKADAETAMSKTLQDDAAKQGEPSQR